MATQPYREEEKVTELVRKLPIFPRLQHIWELVSTHRIVSIHANTGSGKSTLVPTMLVRQGSRTIVTTPTVVAARNLCFFTAEYYPEISVGMGCGGKVTYTDQTQLVYCTAGHLWRMLMRLYKDKKPLPFDILVMDEAHTVSKDYEVLKSMVQKSWPTNAFRLLISSATVDSKAVQAEWSSLSKVEILEIEVPHYPIEETFDSDNFDPQKEDDLLKATVNYIVQQNQTMPPGHFLVFLPGSSTINKMYDLLYAEDSLSNTEVYPCYSSMPDEEIQKAVQQQMPRGRHDKFRAIILSTDILETSVTIPGVVLVVDTGFQKIMTSFNNGMASKLSTIPASGFSVRQRRGRTGRTNPGRVHRMYTESFKQLMRFSYPMELERVPIFDLILEILHFGLQPEEMLPEKIHYKIRESLRYLQQQKLITEDLRLEENALFVVNLPISIQQALFLRDMVLQQDTLSAQLATLLVAALETTDGSSLFYLPRRTREQDMDKYLDQIKNIRSTVWSRFVAEDDLTTQILVMIYFLQEVCWARAPQGSKQLSFTQRTNQWCSKHRLNSKKVLAAQRLYRRLWNQVSESKNDDSDGYLYQHFVQTKDPKSYVTQVVQKTFLPSLMRIFADNIFTEGFDEGQWYARDRTMFYRVHSQNSVINGSLAPSNKLLALSRIHIEKKRTLGFICNLVPIYDKPSARDSPADDDSSDLEDGFQDPDY